jgi:hypothetical protein
MSGFLYLIYPKEFIDTNENIYKLGCTGREFIERFKEYTKGTTIIYVSICNDIFKCESELVKLFNKKYEKIKGREYFRGNYISMKNDIHEQLNKYNNITPIENIMNSKRKLFKRADSCVIKSNILSMYKETSYEKKEKKIIKKKKRNIINISSNKEIIKEQEINKVENTINETSINVITSILSNSEIKKEQEINKLENTINETSKNVITSISSNKEINKVENTMNETSKNISKTIKHYKRINKSDTITYPEIKREEEITKTEFMSDLKYTVFTFYEELDNIDNMSDLLISMKKCFIFVLDTSTWYIWDGEIVKRINSLSKVWTTNMFNSKSIRIRLYDIHRDFKIKYGFNLNSDKDLEKIKNERLNTIINKPIIINNIIINNINTESLEYTSKNIAYIFLSEIFNDNKKRDRTKRYKIAAGKELYELYISWRRKKINDINSPKNIEDLINKANITSSKSLTESIEMAESSKDMQFYREASGTHWFIYKK